MTIEQKCYSVITNYGNELIQKAIAGGQGLIMDNWHIALGTGNLMPKADTKALLNPIYDKNSEGYPGIRIEDDAQLGRGAFIKYPFNLEGIIITELGLFDDKNKLVAVAKTHDDLTYGYNSGNAEIIDKGISLKALPAELKIIVINPPDANPTVEQVEVMLDDYQKLEEKGEPNGYAPLDSNRKVPTEHLPKLSLLPRACINSATDNKLINIAQVIPDLTSNNQGEFVSTSSGTTNLENAYMAFTQDSWATVNQVANAKAELLFVTPVICDYFKINGEIYAPTQITKSGYIEVKNVSGEWVKVVDYANKTTVGATYYANTQQALEFVGIRQTSLTNNGSTAHTSLSAYPVKNMVTVSANTRTLANGETRTLEATSLAVTPKKYKSILPVMTAETIGGYTITADATEASRAAWMIGDGNPATWYSPKSGGAAPAKIKIQMPTAKKIEFYEINSGSVTPNLPVLINNYTFEGSNDGINWVVLDKQTGLSWATLNQIKLFKVNNPNNYLYYRFNSTVGYSIINECKLYEQDPSGEVHFDETQIIGIDGSNQLFTTSVPYTQGAVYPQNPVDGQYHLINDPTKFGMWRFVENVWTQENSVSDVVFCGEVEFKNGAVSGVKHYPFNSNGYDFNNAKAIAELSMPDYSAGISKEWGASHQAACDGWISFRLDYIATPQATLRYSFDNSSFFVIAIFSSNSPSTAQAMYPISKGMYYKAMDGIGIKTLTFYPSKGAKQ